MAYHCSSNVALFLRKSLGHTTTYLTFPGKFYISKIMSLDAYMAIAAVEPKKQYVWDTLFVGGVKANALMARSPERGTTVLDVHSWDVNKDDPFLWVESSAL